MFATESTDLSGSLVDERGAGACILVVDDDPLSRSLQARLVGLLGYRSRVADHVADALDAALDDTVDGMLLDLGMPEVDGFTLLQRLRSAEAQQQRRPLPVIAVTGYAATLDRLRCLMAGFNDHLSKPIEAGALAAALLRNVPTAAMVAAPSNDAVRVEAAARRLSRVKPTDARFAPTLLETFAMRSGQLIEQITKARRAGDEPALTHAIKALRTSAEFMGATGLAALCVQLQAATAAHDAPRAAALVHSLAEEHQSVLTVLLLGARELAPL